MLQIQNYLLLINLKVVSLKNKIRDQQNVTCPLETN